MVEFSEQTGNVERIFVDTVQEKHTRELFNLYPVVLMIDATHGTNLSKYKVFSIMTHDAFDNEQFVQHAIMRNERTSTLLTALEEFERDNPS
ncbi:hypothetical protein F441_18104 [Phytophthora nicotianae CJ01A1]|nr:hypothetical protein L915_17756 [Phytophthora nicotianae]ETL29106.1 hypothetical protein L916_17656 [Phytophthora nicotianae]ETM35554.1 hypothetical protein L914_17568 [Phytophthora nicotianae]ETP05263.1 hypothetical protein F441_18104 [Phytophthora nicotianae CJ01A1]